MSENLKRHRPDIKVLGEGKAIAFMPESPMGVWCHIQEVRDLLDVKDKEIAELKAKLEDAKATAYAESVDAGMRERRLKRALYKACANWARIAAMSFWNRWHDVNFRKWQKVKRKCINKAKEYK